MSEVPATFVEARRIRMTESADGKGYGCRLVQGTVSSFNKSVVLRRELSFRTSEKQLPSHHGSGFIAARSGVSRQMKAGILRFLTDPAVFGIFNRTHSRKSAERITVIEKSSRMQNTICSFCRCDAGSLGSHPLESAACKHKFPAPACFHHADALL